MTFEKNKIDPLLQSLISDHFPGVALAFSKDQQVYFGSAGNLNIDSQFFIASTTKLFVTALILELVDSKRMQLDDKISKYLSAEILQGLHVYKGIDSSDQLTITNLLSHTSGLPDYFQAPRKAKKSLMDQVLNGEDRKWSFEQVIEDSKNLGAVFFPSSGKALYSDTNFQLLGKIIENIYEKTFAQVVDQQICKKLNLKNTYLYLDENDQRPKALNYKKQKLNIPQAMTSFGSDGGMVSNLEESLIFLKSFFEGQLFAKQHLEVIATNWKNVFFPMKYGIGISLFRLPWYFSPFKKFPDLIGHSGLSGAFYYYCPEKNIYLVGTVNQIAKPESSFKLMLKVLSKIE